MTTSNCSFSILLKTLDSFSYSFECTWTNSFHNPMSSTPIMYWFWNLVPQYRYRKELLWDFPKHGPKRPNKIQRWMAFFPLNLPLQHNPWSWGSELKCLRRSSSSFVKDLGGDLKPGIAFVFLIPNHVCATIGKKPRSQIFLIWWGISKKKLRLQKISKVDHCLEFIQNDILEPGLWLKYHTHLVDAQG